MWFRFPINFDDGWFSNTVDPPAGGLGCHGRPFACRIESAFAARASVLEALTALAKCNPASVPFIAGCNKKPFLKLRILEEKEISNYQFAFQSITS